jgi:FkbM family methyltransferase
VLARLGPGDVCLDLGANVGKVTERLAATGARVHAVEPDPDNFAALKARVGHMPNVVLHAAAVGARPGRMQMFRPVVASVQPGDMAPQGVTGQFRAGKSDATSAFAVEVIALDDLIARAGGRVALVKMDIEGGEFEILAAMMAGDLRIACTAMFVETHERHYRDTWPALRATRHAVRGRTDPMISLYWG